MCVHVRREGNGAYQPLHQLRKEEVPERRICADTALCRVLVHQVRLHGSLERPEDEAADDGDAHGHGTCKDENRVGVVRLQAERFP